ncbi:MAG: BCCT family transporter [Roseovarius sp.]
MLFLGLSRIGSTRLDALDERPEFSFTSWLAMIFSGGMATSMSAEQHWRLGRRTS